MYQKLFLLFAALCIGFFSAEMIFRAYYWGEYVGVNDNELCMKRMKQDYLPTDKIHTGSKMNFVNFTRTGYWRDDPIIGITLKENFKHAAGLPIKNKQGTALKQYLLFGEHVHNTAGMNNLDEFTLIKPNKSTVRIALFGDSITCGGEMPHLFSMGPIIKELVPQSEVLNFCVGGRGIETMYLRYLEHGRKYSPDIVVFNVLINDLVRPFGCPVMTPNLSIVNGKIVVGPKAYQSLRHFYETYQLPLFESYFFKHIAHVYNTYTEYERNLKRGLDLFSVMLADLQEKTRKSNITLLVSLIQGPYPSHAEDKAYEAARLLIREKHIIFFDSMNYFKKYQEAYKNQSFYFIRADLPLGHFNMIGNALFAQGITNILEEQGVISWNQDYYFVNFDIFDYLFFIPVNFTKGKEQDIKVITPFHFQSRLVNDSLNMTEFRTEVQEARDYLEDMLHV